MLDSLHFLLTYQCSGECPHCFVWAGPVGPTMSSSDLEYYLGQAARAGIRDVAFEGGEPFLVYPTLAHGVRLAGGHDMRVTVVTNGVWAVSMDEAERWLTPLAELGRLNIAVSTDDYHGGPEQARRAENAARAAEGLGLDPVIFRTELENVMFRGRAAEELADGVPHGSWDEYDECPHESLTNPSRAHLDALGYLHLCQGLCPGRMDGTTLPSLVETDFLAEHPVLGLIAAEGPAGLVRSFDLPLRGSYADACHLCYRARELLRSRFPDYLGPDRMYGVFDG